jgi:hypothetical protein
MKNILKSNRNYILKQKSMFIIAVELLFVIFIFIFIIFLN